MEWYNIDHLRTKYLHPLSQPHFSPIHRLASPAGKFNPKKHSRRNNGHHDVNTMHDHNTNHSSTHSIQANHLHSFDPGDSIPFHFDDIDQDDGTKFLSLLDAVSSYISMTHQDQEILQNSPISQNNYSYTTLHSNEANNPTKLHTPVVYDQTSLFLRSLIFSQHYQRHTPRHVHFHYSNEFSYRDYSTTHQHDLVFKALLVSLDGSSFSQLHKHLFNSSTDAPNITNTHPSSSSIRSANTHVNTNLNTTSLSSPFTPPRNPPKSLDFPSSYTTHYISPLDTTITTRHGSLFNDDQLRFALQQNNPFALHDKLMVDYPAMLNAYPDIPKLISERTQLAHHITNTLLDRDGFMKMVGRSSDTTPVQFTPLGSTFDFILASQCLECALCQTTLLFQSNNLATNTNSYLTLEVQKDQSDKNHTNTPQSPFRQTPRGHVIGHNPQNTFQHLFADDSNYNPLHRGYHLPLIATQELNQPHQQQSDPSTPSKSIHSTTTTTDLLDHFNPTHPNISTIISRNSTVHEPPTVNFLNGLYVDKVGRTHKSERINPQQLPHDAPLSPILALNAILNSPHYVLDCGHIIHRSCLISHLVAQYPQARLFADWSLLVKSATVSCVLCLNQYGFKPIFKFHPHEILLAALFDTSSAPLGEDLEMAMGFGSGCSGLNSMSSKEPIPVGLWILRYMLKSMTFQTSTLVNKMGSAHFMTNSQPPLNYLFTHQGLLMKHLQTLYHQSMKNHSPNVPSFMFYLVQVPTNQQQSAHNSDQNNQETHHLAILFNNVSPAFLTYLNANSTNPNQRNELPRINQTSPIWAQDPFIAPQQSPLDLLPNTSLHLQVPHADPNSKASIPALTFYPLDTTSTLFPLHLPPTLDPTDDEQQLGITTTPSPTPFYLPILLLLLYQYYTAIATPSHSHGSTTRNTQHKEQKKREQSLKNKAQYLELIKKQSQILVDNKALITELSFEYDALKARTINTFTKRAQMYEFGYEFQTMFQTLLKTSHLPILQLMEQFQFGTIIPKIRYQEPPPELNTLAMNSISPNPLSSRSLHHTLGFKANMKLSTGLGVGREWYDPSTPSPNSLALNLFTALPLSFPPHLQLFLTKLLTTNNHTTQMNLSDPYGYTPHERATSISTFRRGMLIGSLHSTLRESLGGSLYQSLIQQMSNPLDLTPFSHLQYFSPQVLKLYVPPQHSIVQLYKTHGRLTDIFPSQLLLAMFATDSILPTSPLTQLSLSLMTLTVEYMLLLLAQNPVFPEIIGFLRLNATKFAMEQIKAYQSNSTQNRGEKNNNMTPRSKIMASSQDFGGAKSPSPLCFEAVLLYSFLVSEDLMNLQRLPVDLLEIKIQSKSKQITAISNDIATIILKQQLYNILHPNILPSESNPIHNPQPEKSQPKDDSLDDLPTSIQQMPMSKPVSMTTSSSSPPQISSSVAPQPPVYQSTQPPPSINPFQFNRNPFSRPKNDATPLGNATKPHHRQHDNHYTNKNNKSNIKTQLTSTLPPTNGKVPNSTAKKTTATTHSISQITYADQYTLRKQKEAIESQQIEDLLNSSNYLLLVSPRGKKLKDAAHQREKNRLSLPSTQQAVNKLATMPQGSSQYETVIGSQPVMILDSFQHDIDNDSNVMCDLPHPVKYLHHSKTYNNLLSALQLSRHLLDNPDDLIHMSYLINTTMLSSTSPTNHSSQDNFMLGYHDDLIDNPQHSTSLNIFKFADIHLFHSFTKVLQFEPTHRFFQLATKLNTFATQRELSSILPSLTQTSAPLLLTFHEIDHEEQRDQPSHEPNLNILPIQPIEDITLCFYFNHVESVIKDIVNGVDLGLDDDPIAFEDDVADDNAIGDLNFGLYSDDIDLGTQNHDTIKSNKSRSATKSPSVDDLREIRDALIASNSHLLTQFQFISHSTQLNTSPFHLDIQTYHQRASSPQQISSFLQLASITAWFAQLHPNIDPSGSLRRLPSQAIQLNPPSIFTNCFTDLKTFQFLSKQSNIDLSELVILPYHPERHLNEMLNPQSLLSTPNSDATSHSETNGDNEDNEDLTIYTFLQKQFVGREDVSDRDDLLGMNAKDRAHAIKQTLIPHLPAPITNQGFCYLIFYKPFYLHTGSENGNVDGMNITPHSNQHPPSISINSWYHDGLGSFPQSTTTSSKPLASNNLLSQLSYRPKWLTSTGSPEFLALDQTLINFYRDYYHPISSYIDQYSSLFDAAHNELSSAVITSATTPTTNNNNNTLGSNITSLELFQKREVCTITSSSLLYSPIPMFSIKLDLMKASQPIDDFYSFHISHSNKIIQQSKDKINSVLPDLIKLKHLTDEVSIDLPSYKQTTPEFHLFQTFAELESTDGADAKDGYHYERASTSTTTTTPGKVKVETTTNTNSSHPGAPSHIENFVTLLDKYRDEITELHQELEEIFDDPEGKYGPKIDEIEMIMDDILDLIEDLLDILYPDMEKKVIEEMTAVQAMLHNLIKTAKSNKSGGVTINTIFTNLFDNYTRHRKEQDLRTELFTNGTINSTTSKRTTLDDVIPNTNVDYFKDFTTRQPQNEGKRQYEQQSFVIPTLHQPIDPLNPFDVVNPLTDHHPKPSVDYAVSSNHNTVTKPSSTKSTNPFSRSKPPQSSQPKPVQQQPRPPPPHHNQAQMGPNPLNPSIKLPSSSSFMGSLFNPRTTASNASGSGRSQPSNQTTNPLKSLQDKLNANVVDGAVHDPYLSSSNRQRARGPIQPLERKLTWVEPQVDREMIFQQPQQPSRPQPKPQRAHGEIKPSKPSLATSIADESDQDPVFQSQTHTKVNPSVKSANSLINPFAKSTNSSTVPPGKPPSTSHTSSNTLSSSSNPFVSKYCDRGDCSGENDIEVVATKYHSTNTTITTTSTTTQSKSNPASFSSSFSSSSRPMVNKTTTKSTKARATSLMEKRYQKSNFSGSSSSSDDDHDTIILD